MAHAAVRVVQFFQAEEADAEGLEVGRLVAHQRHAGGALQAFAALGLQTAAGVPLMCDEPADFKTFRIGLFGLDKLHNIERTVATFAKALDGIV